MSSADVWKYEGSWRIETFGADGSPQLDDSNSASNGTTTGRVVSYADRSWFATSQRSPAPLACDLVCETRRSVANGSFNVIVKTTLNGRPEFQLARTSSPCGTPNYMLWVDPATYLPVQSVTVLENGGTSETTFTWFTPDAASLAQLVAPIPGASTRR
jgi:hypothetical protein